MWLQVQARRIDSSLPTAILPQMRVNACCLSPPPYQNLYYAAASNVDYGTINTTAVAQSYHNPPPCSAVAGASQREEAWLRTTTLTRRHVQRCRAIWAGKAAPHSHTGRGLRAARQTRLSNLGTSVSTASTPKRDKT